MIKNIEEFNSISEHWDFRIFSKGDYCEFNVLHFKWDLEAFRKIIETIVSHCPEFVVCLVNYKDNDLRILFKKQQDKKGGII
jgi:hypothetical protein